MDAKPAPAQEKRAESNAPGRERQTRHSPDAAGELQRPGEERAEKGERASAAPCELSGERIRKAQRAEGSEQRGKEDHISADLQQRLTRGRYGSAERRAEVFRRRGRPRRCAAGIFPAKENADRGGGERVHPPEQQSPSGGAEHTRAESAHGERRAGIVAEREQMLGLVVLNDAVAVKLSDACRAEGVPAGKTEQEHRRPRAAHAEEARCRRSKTPCERIHRAEPREQSGGGKIRQKRRDKQRPPQPQPVRRALPCLRRGEEK